MAERQAARRALYVVTLWVEPESGPIHVWRGSVETADGNRAYFASLTELNRLLTHKSGWIDPASDSKESQARIAEKEKQP